MLAVPHVPTTTHANRRATRMLSVWAPYSGPQIEARSGAPRIKGRACVRHHCGACNARAAENPYARESGALAGGLDVPGRVNGHLHSPQVANEGPYLPISRPVSATFDRFVWRSGVGAARWS